MPTRPRVRFRLHRIRSQVLAAFAAGALVLPAGLVAGSAAAAFPEATVTAADTGPNGQISAERAAPPAASLGPAGIPRGGTAAYRLDRGDAGNGDAGKGDAGKGDAGGQARVDPDQWVYFLPVYWASTPSADPAEGKEAAVKDADDYLRTATNGQVRTVLAWTEPWSHIEMSSTEAASCDRDAIWREASALIEGGGVASDHVVIVLPGYSACSWKDVEYRGVTSRGYGLSMMNGTSTPAEQVVERAVLHNNGVTTTGSLDCTSSGAPVPLSSSCTQRIFTNPWDPTSGRPYGQVGMPIASTLSQFGVLASADYPQASVGSARTFTIARLGAAGGVRGFWFDLNGYRYHVDYRTATGVDAWIDDRTYSAASGTKTDPGGGVTVHRQSLTDGVGSRNVVDFHPEARGSADTERHPGLDAGESYTFPDGYVKLAVTSANSSSATVEFTSPALSKVARWSGEDRYATSAQISARTFDPGVATAYIASGEVYADALSGAPVAGKNDGPILLTRSSEIPDVVAAELRRLDPKQIVVLGGPATISSAVESALNGFTTGAVQRWSGADRYATSAAISARSYPPGVNVAYLASGRVFTDALSGAPVAGKTRGPVLLVDTTSVPSVISAELQRLNPDSVVILGGTSTISSGVQAEVGALLGKPVTRWSGDDRFTTSTAITQASYDPPVNVAYIASGRLYTDALSGAPVAGATGGPILLVDSTKIPSSVGDELQRLQPKQIVVLGGPNTISLSVQAELAQYVRE